MAELHITEYAGVGHDKMGTPVQVAHNELNRQIVSISESSACSGNISGNYVRLFSDCNCKINFGPDPTADHTGIPLASESVEFFYVNLGDKIAVVSR